MTTACFDQNNGLLCQSSQRTAQNIQGPSAHSFTINICAAHTAYHFSSTGRKYYPFTLKETSSYNPSRMAYSKFTHTSITYSFMYFKFFFWYY